MENILTVLSSDDREEIRKAVKNIIIDRFEKDLDEYRETYHVFSANDMEDMIQSIYDEISDEIKEDFKEKMAKEFEKKMEAIQ